MSKDNFETCKSLSLYPEVKSMEQVWSDYRSGKYITDNELELMEIDVINATNYFLHTKNFFGLAALEAELKGIQNIMNTRPSFNHRFSFQPIK